MYIHMDTYAHRYTDEHRYTDAGRQRDVDRYLATARDRNSDMTTEIGIAT